jgi:Flp pilus assembly protein TadG
MRKPVAIRGVARDYSGREYGIAALEFVLILPFLLMVLIGIIDMTLLLHDEMVLTNAAREGARYGVAYRATLASVSQIQAVVSNYTAGSLISSSASTQPTITVTPANQNTTNTASGQPLQVTVTYVYKGIVIGTFLNLLPGGSSGITLTASSVMLYE